MGINETVDPIWNPATAPSPTVKCLWQAPQFFNGSGENQIRRALKQQLHFVANAIPPHNEVILDGQALNNAIAQDSAHAIAAFFFPVGSPGCEAIKCSDTAYQVRASYQKKYGVAVPVIGLNLTNGDAPFVVVPPPPAGGVRSEVSTIVSVDRIEE